MCVCVCVCVCSQASHSRATLSCDSSYCVFCECLASLEILFVASMIPEIYDLKTKKMVDKVQ